MLYSICHGQKLDIMICFSQMLSSTPGKPRTYPIRVAAKLSGVPIDCLRAWERRYQAVTPVREGRSRVYSDSDVQRLGLLRKAVDGGHAIGQVARLTETELRDLTSTPTAANAVPVAALELGPLVAAIESLDSIKLNEHLAQMDLLLSARDLVYGVVLPLLRVSGEFWEQGRWNVAHEHMLSAAVRNLLGSLLRRPSPGSPAMVFTTAPGEWHEFGALLASLLAVSHGFAALYLGPNTPASDIRFAAEQSAAIAVVLGILQANATPDVQREIQELASALPYAMELWVGGSGAEQATQGASRANLLVLEDMEAFERNLIRLKSSYLLAEAR
jgi:DNA-binding transcriptional MerR regulator